MKLLEYEAKVLLQESGIPVPRSRLIVSVNDSLPALPTVLKSQVPTGGRGKAGGVQVVEEEFVLHSTIKNLFSLSIKGFTPRVLLAEEKLDIVNEYYLALLIDKPSAEIRLMVHRRGGIEVEENDSTSFLSFSLDNKNSESAGGKLAEYFDLPTQSFVLRDMIKNLYACFIKNDATVIEINPLIYTADKKLIAADCKIELDTAAGFRHSEWHFEDTPADSNFVTLDNAGNIATIANGAGLAMATVDAVTDFGMRPANFLDIGGGANSKTILAAFEKIMKHFKVKAIIINIFAGITRCDEVAKAIIDAKRHIPTLPPLFIRLAGTNVEIAKELLTAQDIPFLPTLGACLEAAKERVNHE